jgi:hypothetical protein
MRIHWTLGSVPELGALEAGERRSVFRNAVRQHLGVGRRLLCAAPAGLGAGIGIWLGQEITDHILVSACIAGCFGWIGGVIGQSLLIDQLSPHLGEAAAARTRGEQEVGS